MKSILGLIAVVLLTGCNSMQTAALATALEEMGKGMDAKASKNTSLYDSSYFDQYYAERRAKAAARRDERIKYERLTDGPLTGNGNNNGEWNGRLTDGPLIGGDNNDNNNGEWNGRLTDGPLIGGD